MSGYILPPKPPKEEIHNVDIPISCVAGVDAFLPPPSICGGGIGSKHSSRHGL